MTVQDIRSRVEGKFVPFKIRTSDGREYEVPHRDFIFVTPKRVAISSLEGYVMVFDPLHIVAIEEADPDLAKPSGSGA